MDQKIIISHRGNLDGPNPLRENRIDYIIESLDVCLFTEVDLWRFGEYLFLSHDKPLTTAEYQMGIEQFLFEYKDRLVIHCKNIQALQLLAGLKNSAYYNFFWHENDTYTLTNKGWIWAYPDKQVTPTRNLQVQPFTVAVLPELSDTNLDNFFAICTDSVKTYMARNEKALLKETEKELKKI